MTKKRETQFVAALLMCGAVANIKLVLEFDRVKLTTDHPDARRAFKMHKQRLIRHLLAADYFDVYYHTSRHLGVAGGQLTERAALWIGEFYKWMLREQGRREHSG